MNVVAHEPSALIWLRGALADFYRRDRELLRLGAGETAVTFRIGHHLALRVGSEWDVDAEYDREGEDGAQKRRDDLGMRHMRPDLVVHRRGLSGHTNNLLFLEVKLIWQPTVGDPDDLDKVRMAVARQYQFGVVLGMTHATAALDRFSPTWTVYTVAIDRDDAAEEAKPLAEAEPVFDDVTLTRLKIAADRAGTRTTVEHHW